MWIKRQSITDHAAALALPRNFGEGEREAIILAQELGAVLLIDDPEARDTAARLRIPFLGSLGILREAKLRGMIPVVRPDLDALRAYHFRVSDVLYQTFIQQMGEA